MKTIYILIGILYLTITINAQDAVFYKLPNGTAPVIDGTIDALWTGVEVHTINKTLNGYSTPTPNTSTWQAVWNDTAVFILVNARDNSHCDEWCSGQPSYIADRLEVYFDVNDTLIDGLGASSQKGHFQFAPAWQQGINQYSTYTMDWQGFKFKYAYKITGENFVYEYAIPFTTLKNKKGIVLNPNTVDSIGFDICFNDLDRADATRRMALWKNDKESSWNNMDKCGRVSFSNNTQPKVQVISSAGNLSNGSSYNMGFATPNVTKEATLTLKNMGLQDLIISSITVSGAGFSVIPPVDLTLSPFETQTVKIDFLRTPVGVYTGTLKIMSNDPVNGTTNINIVIGNGLTIVNGGDVSGNWVKSNSPYYVYGNIVVPTDSVLNIQHGVSVIFQGYYYFEINGSLLALGNQSDSIRFTINDTTNFSKFNLTSGSWQGLYMPNNSSDSTKLLYCIIDHAKIIDGSLKDNARGGGLMVASDKLLIAHSMFYKNHVFGAGGAIYVVSSGSKVMITDTKFFNNSSSNSGGALYMANNAKATFENCTFYGNSAQTGGAIEICCNSVARIINSIISNNIASDAGGGINLMVSNSYLINNVITNNEAHGAFSGGGGLTINNCQPYLYNNNICYNKSYHDASGVLLWDISPANFTNNILWGNIGLDGSQSQINIGTAGQPILNHCIIQKGFSGVHKEEVYNGDTTTIIGKDPKFTGAPSSAGLSYNGLNANWNVAHNSITINSGATIPLNQLKVYTDFYNNNRVIHSFIDIGAVETHIASFQVHGNITHDTLWVADTVKVTGNLKLTDSASLTIAPGTIVQFQGHYFFKVQGTMKAIGLSTAPIKFTVIDTLGISNTNDTASGSWNGIGLNNGFWDGANYKMPLKDSIIFDYCILEYAKNMDYNWDQTVGGAIQIKYYSNVRVSNCQIRNNYANRGAGINIDGFSNPVVRNNKIYNNKATYGSGGVHIDGNSTPYILNNFIFNNTGGTGGGLSINTSNAYVINNVISNNQSAANAGGVYFSTSYPVFANNTVVNNLAAWEGGGICVIDCDALIYNTILWGNKANSGAASLATYTHPVLYNCLIENGKSSVGNVPDLEINNMITSKPAFKNPNPDMGLSDNALTSDWSITTFSNAIDSGTNSYGYTVSSDISGNPRINDGVIDIGAFENQGKKVEFTKQPVGLSLCEGNTISLSVSLSDTAKIQWQKDGNDIDSATGNTLKIYSIRGNNQGNYVCVASNAFGKVYSNPVFIQVRKNPVITEQPEGGLVSLDETVKLDTRADGETPLSYHWYVDSIAIAGDTLFRLQIDSFKLKNEGNYYCIVTNVCSNVTSRTASLTLAPQICMVTARDSTANIVVFEKGSIASYSKFNVYREGITLGYYEKLSSVLSSSPGIYIDNIDPRAQAYLYKITGVKTNNSETDLNLCNTHKTMHLRVSKGVPSGYQLDWDEYIGFPYSTYYIYRSTDGGVSFDSIHAMSSSTRSYTDYSAPDGYLLYYVAVIKTDGCYPNGRMKGGSDIYSQSVSNLEDNRLRSSGISNTEVDKLNLTSYPNPYRDNTTINYNLQKTTNVKIEVYNLLGKIVATIVNEKQLAGNNQFRFNPVKYGLSNGIFILKLKAENKISSIRLVGLK